ncbi:hypothetical protein ACLD0U_04290 [Microbacterium sp. 2216-1]
MSADTEHAPAQWTPQQEAEYVARVHGSDDERIAALVAQQNESQRHR